jgi:hypothetical protein
MTELRPELAMGFWSVIMKHNGQVLPMVGNFIFDRPEQLPGFIRQASNDGIAELLLLIAHMSSPTIGNTNVSG